MNLLLEPKTDKRRLVLRDYQIPAVEFAMLHAISVLAMCPNGGKTEIAIDVIIRYLLLHPSKKVLILAHSTNVLLDNFLDRLKELDISFTYSTDFDPNADVHICLPQNENEILSNLALHKYTYGFVTIDEAHQNYLAERVRRLLDIINPDKQLLLTGTPSKFIKNGGYNIYTFAANEMPDQYYAKVQIELVASNYDWKDEVEVEQSFVFNKKETEKTLENVLLKLIERIKYKFPASEFNNPNFLTKLKTYAWDLAYKKIGKTMIICKTIDQAKLTNDILLKNGVNSTVSDSITDEQSLRIIDFKNNEFDVLVVVDRARLGFSDDLLYNIIDMSGTLNPDLIYQIFCRVLRGTPSMEKLYMKVSSQKSGMMDVTTACVSAALMLTDKHYLSTFNGSNFNGILIPTIKTSIKSEGREAKKPGSNGNEQIIFPEFTKSINVMIFFKNVLHDLDKPASIYKLTTIGEIKNKLGLLSHIDFHSKYRTLEIARNYKGKNFQFDFSREHSHACRYNYLHELRKVLNEQKYLNRKNEILEIVRNYKGKNFSEDFSKEYSHARKYKYLHEINKILDELKPLNRKNEILEIARNYKGKNFAKDCPGEYAYAIKNKFLDELNVILKANKTFKRKNIGIIKNHDK